MLDAPYDFTVRDMPTLRKWWCVLLMENFDLGSHGTKFAHWTDTAKAILRDEVPLVFCLKRRKVDDVTEGEDQVPPVLQHPEDRDEKDVDGQSCGQDHF